MTLARRLTGLARGAGGFSDPSDVSTLVAWYDFSDTSSLWKDTGRTTPVTSDSDVIKGVTDKSGGGRHLSEASNGPVYLTGQINGVAAASFAAGSQKRLQTGSFTALNPPLTVIAVSDPQPGTDALFVVDGDATERLVMYFAADQTDVIYAGTNLASSDTSDRADHVVSGLFNGGSSEIWRDGVSKNTGNAGTSSPTKFTVGSDPALAAFFFDGLIGEIVIYNADSTTDRENVEGYLKDKWGTP